MHINQKIPLPRAGRYATTHEDILINAIKNTKPEYDWENDDDEDDRSFDDCLRDALDRNYKDLSIDIDFENVMPPVGGDLSDITEDSVEYLNVNGKKVPCFFLEVGGDWQVPAAILVYSDPKGKIRLYFPKQGNLFNPKKKRAIEDNEEDLPDIRPYVDDKYLDEYDDPNFSLYVDAEIDWDLVKADCCTRLIPVD